MSRVFLFNVAGGELKFKEAAKTIQLSPFHELAWNVLVDWSSPVDEWVIAFNILGPSIVGEVIKANPESVKPSIDRYRSTLDPKSTEFSYLEALSDDHSKLTQVYRSVLEFTLNKYAADPSDLDNIMRLGELEQLKPYLARVPKYVIGAVVESVNLLRDYKPYRTDVPI